MRKRNRGGSTDLSGGAGLEQRLIRGMHGVGRKMEQRNWREMEGERQETVRHRSQGREGQTVGLETDPAGQ